MTTHYAEEALAAFAEDVSPFADEIGTHVRSCSPCGAAVAEYRHVAALLIDGRIWEREQFGAGSFDFEAFAWRMRVEGEQAAELCERILTGPVAWWPQRLRAVEVARTPALVQHLIDRLRRWLQNSPANADVLSVIAVEIAEELQTTDYPSPYLQTVYGQALRERSHVLAYRSRYPEALDFAQRADDVFDAIPAAEMERARLNLVKALIFRNINRSDEACSLARNAADTLLRLGERRRYLEAKLIEGIAVYAAGAIDNALEIWRSIETDPAQDDMWSTRMAHNIGLCLADLGQHDAAIPYLYRAAVQLEVRGLHAECTRTRATLGKSLLMQGRMQEAIPILQYASREFEKQGMVWETGIVTMELVEALLATGQSQDVPELCRGVITQFAAIGMAHRATAALTYLREAALQGAAAPEHAREARTSLRRLQSMQPQLFAHAREDDSERA